MNFIDVVKKSLESISSFNIPLELILVDNGSNDGSFQLLEEFIHKLDITTKVIRLSSNLGFTGANNIGYLCSDPQSKYIVLINNDLIPEEGSLERLVKFMEKHRNVGAVQGVVYDICGKKIDNAGFICSETLVNYPIKSFPQKPIRITYASGSYMVIRKEALIRLRRLFDWDGFAYFDDWPLGYRLWMNGYKVLAIPTHAGRHLGGATFRPSKKPTPTSLYYIIRGHAMLVETSNSRFRDLIKVRYLMSLPLRGAIPSRNLRSLFAAYVRGVLEGLRLGRVKRQREGILDIYAAPFIKSSPSSVVREIIVPFLIRTTL